MDPKSPEQGKPVLTTPGGHFSIPLPAARVVIVPVALVLSYLSFVFVSQIDDLALVGYVFFWLPSLLMPTAFVGVAWLFSSRRLSVLVGVAVHLGLGLGAYLLMLTVAHMEAPLAIPFWPTAVLWVFGCDLPLIGFCMN